MQWYVLALSIYALIGGISYAAAKLFNLPNVLPLVLVVLVAPAIVSWLYVSGHFR